ncbi:hypothetical protein [Streptomyces geranii]|uniref:hypothetical protein n=1 Tax=Streptomyces geranii TaxID=2058923 RepID=UPI0013004E2E|nr:hypothetical protein [Streptomyces geranii]
MDPATAAVTVVSIVVSQACALFSLWLRLRWRVRHEQAQRQYLAGTVEAVAAGGQLKVDEHRDDGGRLRVELTCGPARTREGDE